MLNVLLVSVEEAIASELQKLLFSASFFSVTKVKEIWEEVSTQQKYEAIVVDIDGQEGEWTLFHSQLVHELPPCNPLQTIVVVTHDWETQFYQGERSIQVVNKVEYLGCVAPRVNKILFPAFVKSMSKAEDASTEEKTLHWKPQILSSAPSTSQYKRETLAMPEKPTIVDSVSCVSFDTVKTPCPESVFLTQVSQDPPLPKTASFSLREVPSSLRPPPTPPAPFIDPSFFEDREITPVSMELAQLEVEAFPLPPKIHMSDLELKRWIRSMRGQRIASFLLEKEVGRGGAGVVLQGIQMSLGRKVAVKILLPHLTKDVESIHRFQAEAWETAKLQSPHIVQILETGHIENRVFFIVSNWLEGLSLDKYVKSKGRLSYSASLSIVGQITKGLQVAHEVDLIHRDLKPSNIMIGPSGHATITDFGLVYNQKIAHQGERGKRVLGTPHYISPEQAMAIPLDARSDIYSLGILFYELLTGYPPFEAADPLDLIRAHVMYEMPDPRHIRPDIPQQLAEIVMKMGSKKRDSRYQDTGELWRALQLAYEEISLQGDNTPHRARQDETFSSDLGYLPTK